MHAIRADISTWVCRIEMSSECWTNGRNKRKIPRLINSGGKQSDDNKKWYHERDCKSTTSEAKREDPDANVHIRHACVLPFSTFIFDPSGRVFLYLRALLDSVQIKGCWWAVGDHLQQGRRFCVALAFIHLVSTAHCSLVARTKT
jgi:hypothetical protein